MAKAENVATPAQVNRIDTLLATGQPAAAKKPRKTPDRKPMSDGLRVIAALDRTLAKCDRDAAIAALIYHCGRFGLAVQPNHQ